MAVVEIARSPDDAVVIDAEYDANRWVRRFTITNNGGSTVTATVYKPSVGGEWSLVAAPGQTASDTVPANLVSFPLDDAGQVAYPHVTLGPYWVGYFDVWHVLVVMG